MWYRLWFKTFQLIYIILILMGLCLFITSLMIGNGVDLGFFQDLADGSFHLID